jgi:4-hydroxy-2-oxoheptanedioate aldolase|tara:strand:+ start:5348 stop:6100 length:753 start_codon:yes stop_codon:yes gene_type:complete
MKNLVTKLKLLHKNYNVIGIKQSTEDEGAKYNDILTMRRITELCDLKLSIKIGGCEAKNDINFCRSINAEGIVAPMVESKFALQKFIESIIHLQHNKFYINIESKTAYENLDNILSSPSSKLLSGIVIGRSDLTKSYGFGKDYVDSSQIQDVVYNILTKCKEYNITTLMGGNVSPKSENFIKKLYNQDLLDYIETRNIIIKLNKNNIKCLSPLIKSVLLFESEWLQYKAHYYNEIGKEYTDRSNLILNRF